MSNTNKKCPFKGIETRTKADDVTIISKEFWWCDEGYGLDIPRAEVGICLRPTLSRALYMQMIGRDIKTECPAYTIEECDDPILYSFCKRFFLSSLRGGK